MCVTLTLYGLFAKTLTQAFNKSKNNASVLPRVRVMVGTNDSSDLRGSTWGSLRIDLRLEPASNGYSAHCSFWLYI